MKELTREEKVYYILKDLGKRLGNVRYGSAAFDIELGQARREILKLIDKEPIRFG